MCVHVCLLRQTHCEGAATPMGACASATFTLRWSSCITIMHGAIALYAMLSSHAGSWLPRGYLGLGASALLPRKEFPMCVVCFSQAVVIVIGGCAVSVHGLRSRRFLRPLSLSHPDRCSTLQMLLEVEVLVRVCTVQHVSKRVSHGLPASWPQRGPVV